MKLVRPSKKILLTILFVLVGIVSSLIVGKWVLAEFFPYESQYVEVALSRTLDAVGYYTLSLEACVAQGGRTIEAGFLADDRFPECTSCVEYRQLDNIYEQEIRSQCPVCQERSCNACALSASSILAADLIISCDLCEECTTCTKSVHSVYKGRLETLQRECILECPSTKCPNGYKDIGRTWGLIAPSDFETEKIGARCCVPEN